MKNTYLSREIIPKKINKTSINVAKRMVVNKPQPSSLFIYRKAQAPVLAPTGKWKKRGGSLTATGAFIHLTPRGKGLKLAK